MGEEAKRPRLLATKRGLYLREGTIKTFFRNDDIRLATRLVASLSPSGNWEYFRPTWAHFSAKNDPSARLALQFPRKLETLL